MVSICEVVRMTGVLRFQFLKAVRWPRPICPRRKLRGNIVGMLLHEVGIEVVQGPPHLFRMFLIDAKDDGLAEAVVFFRNSVRFGQWPRCGREGDTPARSPWSGTPRRGFRGRSGQVRRWAASRPRPRW